MFDLFTEDGSDVLSIENLERVLKTCGREPSSKDLREVIRLVDPTGLLEFISIQTSFRQSFFLTSIIFFVILDKKKHPFFL